MTDTSLLIDGALAGMCLLLVATFGLVWRLNERMGKVYGAIFDEPYGLMTMLEKLSIRFDTLDVRVGDVERALERAD